MTISERLKLERKLHNLSQPVMAAIGGVQANAQLGYEKGTRFPDAQYLERLSSASIDVGYILTGRRFSLEIPCLLADEDLFLRSLREMASEDRIAIERILTVISGLANTQIGSEHKMSQTVALPQTPARAFAYCFAKMASSDAVLVANDQP